jgi:hypothetical protein
MQTPGQFFSNMFGKESTHQGATPPVQVNHPGTNLPATAGQLAPETPGMATNGVVPPNTDTSEPNPTAPLDAFTDIWKNAPIDPAAPVDDGTVFGKVNPDDLIKAASGMDFTKVITPELQARIAAGGEDGVRANMEAMALVTRQTYAQASFATTKLIEQAIAKNNARLESKLPNALRAHNTDSLMRENAVLSHPAAKPMVEGLVNQFQTKYPDASPAEIKRHAEDYFIQFSQSMINSQTAATTQANNDTDWNKWFAG